MIYIKNNEEIKGVRKKQNSKNNKKNSEKKKMKNNGIPKFSKLFY